MWTEASEQVKKGLLLGPIPPFDTGRPLEWRPNRFNISFRFGPLQADELRACGDLMHSMANLACAVHTPIQLVSRGHLVHLSQLMASAGGIGRCSCRP